MRQEGFSRRSYFQLLGGVPFSSSHLPKRSDRRSVKEDVYPSELVISQEQAPSDFEVADDTERVPLLEYVSSAGLCLDKAQTATQGYWKGTNEQNPHWVLSSFAIVCDEPISRRTIEPAAQQCYSDYVDEYDAETPDYVDLAQSRTTYSAMTDWQMVIQRSDSPSHSSDYLFKDTMRLQYHQEVLLGTIVFGPNYADREVESMFVRFSQLQRSQL